MRERQLVCVQYMSTFHGTNGMSIKRRYTDAFSPVGPRMLSGDAALLFLPYSGCTGNILSFYPSTSPRSISDPLTVNDFFRLPKFASSGFPSSPLPSLHVLLLARKDCLTSRSLSNSSDIRDGTKIVVMRNL